MTTSERQLLSVIEKTSGAVPAAPSRAGINVAALAATLGGRLDGFSRRLRSEALRITTLNLLLAGAIIVVSVYLALSILSSVRESRRAFDTAGNLKPPASSAGASGASALKDLEYYEDLVGGRDIFRIGGTISKSDGQKPAVEQQLIADAARSLRLVGVAWSENPDVMIEDESKGVTYFLRRGESMENGIRVKEVSRDTVILEFEQETIELK